jgi:hypothetical protein
MKSELAARKRTRYICAEAITSDSSEQKCTVWIAGGSDIFPVFIVIIIYEANSSL